LKKSPKLGHTKSTTESKLPLYHVVLSFNEFDAQEVNNPNFVVASKRTIGNVQKKL
jgi:hypothetical protein